MCLLPFMCCRGRFAQGLLRCLSSGEETGQDPGLTPGGSCPSLALGMVGDSQAFSYPAAQCNPFIFTQISLMASIFIGCCCIAGR